MLPGKAALTFNQLIEREKERIPSRQPHKKQFILNKELEGLRVRMPSGTRNFWVDGAKPTPH